MFLLFFVLFAYVYEELGFVGYFGYSDIFILLTTPNILYLALSFIKTDVRKYLKQILLIGNGLVFLAATIYVLVWLAGWD